MESLPVIDFSNPDRHELAKELTKAMEVVGFVYLDNVPGYNREVEEKLYKAASWFFSLPLDEKLRVSPRRWNKDAAGVYRGYVPMETAHMHFREQYEVGELLPDDDPDKMSGNPMYEATPWPKEESFPFREFVSSYHSAMLSAGIEFLRLTAIGLGLDEHVFDDKFLPKSVSSVRLMHYPAAPQIEGQSPTFTCAEHYDSSFVILLATFSNPGLEILMDDGTWMGVNPRPGSLIANVGELLSKVVNGKYKATRHRVRDIGRDRFSVPFFFEPRFHAKFNFPDSTSIIYGPWMIQSMKRHQEYADCPDFPAVLSD